MINYIWQATMHKVSFLLKDIDNLVPPYQKATWKWTSDNPLQTQPLDHSQHYFFFRRQCWCIRFPVWWCWWCKWKGNFELGWWWQALYQYEPSTKATWHQWLWLVCHCFYHFASKESWSRVFLFHSNLAIIKYYCFMDLGAKFCSCRQLIRCGLIQDWSKNKWEFVCVSCLHFEV